MLFIITEHLGIRKALFRPDTNIHPDSTWLMQNIGLNALSALFLYLDHF